MFLGESRLMGGRRREGVLIEEEDLPGRVLAQSTFLS